VKQNIAIFGSKKHISMRAVREAAKLAEVTEVINKLPEKFDTYLTKSLENGTELSTGQWQRIAVARQFYANRPLVILDEPTSAIDPIAEAKIFSNLYEHVKDKTVIVVSHRYNTVRAAKKILVFNDGQIIEQGSHSELLKKKGYYAKAFAVQQEEKKL
jgi:ATP-binding cassette subfamily B protein